MYHKLLSLMAKPDPHRSNIHPFWDDDHISQRMLDAHLTPDWDAASRTHAFMDASADWIAQVAPPEHYPRLLDLGCGPGLYARRFEERGYRVLGIDLSRRSVAYAQGLGLRCQVGNYCELNLNETFDLVTLIYCDFGALPPADRREVLRRAHAHLRPGGRMILDVFSLAHERGFQPYQTWQHYPEGGFWRTEPYILLEEGMHYPNHVIGRQIHVITERDTASYWLWDTCYSPELMQTEVEQAGFCLSGIYGDVAGAPFTPESDVLAAVLQKA